MFGLMFQEGTSQTQLFLSMPAIIAMMIILGLIGLASLWRKGKTVEAILLLNTTLLIIVILLLLFPPNA